MSRYRRSSVQKHEIQRNLDIVRALGADENDFEYDLVLTDAEVNEAERIYQSLGIVSREDGGGRAFRRVESGEVFSS